MSKLNICYIINASGCSWWRGAQPGQMISHLGLSDVYVHDVVRSTKSDLVEAMEQSDIIFSQSPASVEAIASFYGMQQKGKKVVVDYDDLSFQCSPLNPAYRTLGLHEITVNADGREISLWKDGEDGFHLAENLLRYRNMRESLYVADAVTTTTDYLKERLLNLAPERKNDFYSIPNAINLSRWSRHTPRVRTPKKIRVGWAGAANHLEDWSMIVHQIKELMDRNPDIILVIMGNVLADITQIIPKDRVEWHDWVDIEYYPDVFSTLQLDIALCPLVDNEFTRCKSPLKWAEYAAVNSPVICSPVQPYLCLENNQEVLFAEKPEDWITKVEQLIKDRDLRHHLKESAYERVRREFNLEHVAHQWFATFKKVFESDSSASPPDSERLRGWEDPDAIPFPSGCATNYDSSAVKHIPKRSQLPAGTRETGNYIALPDN